MDTTMILIFIGFILCGVTIASPIAYTLGQRSMKIEDTNEILEAEVIE